MSDLEKLEQAFEALCCALDEQQHEPSDNVEGAGTSEEYVEIFHSLNSIKLGYHEIEKLVFNHLLFCMETRSYSHNLITELIETGSELNDIMVVLQELVCQWDDKKN